MIEENPIKTTVEELSKLVNIQNFIGEPIEIEDKILIPVSKVGVGFGVGENNSSRVLTGAGGGAGIEPVSMVVITKGVYGIEGIRTLNLSEGNEYNKALSDLGLIVGDLLKTFLGSMAGMDASASPDDTVINVDDMENMQNGEYSEKEEELKTENIQDAVDDIKESVEDIKEDTKDTSEDIKEKTDDTVENIKETTENIN